MKLPNSPNDELASILGHIGIDDDDDDWLERIRLAEAPPNRSQIGRFTLLDEVHRGGQGVVYKAVDTHNGCHVALKRLPRRALASTSARRRFARELRAASLLNHPNIVTVYGVEYIEDFPLLVMKWIHGTPITQWITLSKGNRRDCREIAIAMCKVCAAVAHAHEHGIIHRDLKPSNVLVDEAGEPQLLDFGLAKFLNRDDATNRSCTITGDFVGTLAYCSPEQIRGERDCLDVRSDVYALGIIFYELLTGRTPYNVGRNLAEAANLIATHQPKRPSSVVKQVDPALDAIALKALTKEKANRYQTAVKLADDLRRYVRNEPLLARHPRLLKQAIGFTKRRKGLVAALSVIFLLLGTTAVGTGYGLGRAASERDRAQAEAAKYVDIVEFFSDTLSSVTMYALMYEEGGELTFTEIFSKTLEPRIEPMLTNKHVRGDVHQILGAFYKAFSDRKRAEDHFRRAVELRRLARSDDLKLAKSLTDFGSILIGQHRYQDASLILTEALDIFHKQPPDDPIWKVRALWGLSYADVWKHRHDDAHRHLSDAVDLLKHDPRPEVQSMLIPLYIAIARLHEQQCNYKDGEQILANVMNSFDQSSYANEYLRAKALFRLGGILWSRSDYPLARKLFLQCKEIFARTHGTDSVDYRLTTNSIAVCLRDEGQWDEAEQIFTDLLESHSALSDSDTPLYGNVHVNLAWLYYYRGDLESARSFTLRAFKIRSDRLASAPDDAHSGGHLYNNLPSDVAECHALLARINLLTGHLLEATEHSWKALELNQNVLPPEHWLIADTRIILAACRSKDADFDESERMMSNWLDRIREARGPQGRRTIDAENWLNYLNE